MKHLIFFLLFPFFLGAQQIVNPLTGQVSDFSINYDTFSLPPNTPDSSEFALIQSAPGNLIWITPDVDCKYWESYSEWVSTITGYTNCAHSWAYAEYKDVNESSSVVNAVYCPCGCPDSRNEARICRACKRHETRTFAFGYTMSNEPSEYMRLLGETNQDTTMHGVIIKKCTICGPREWTLTFAKPVTLDDFDVKTKGLYGIETFYSITNYAITVRVEEGFDYLDVLSRLILSKKK